MTINPQTGFFVEIGILTPSITTLKIKEYHMNNDKIILSIKGAHDGYESIIPGVIGQD